MQNVRNRNRRKHPLCIDSGDGARWELELGLRCGCCLSMQLKAWVGCLRKRRHAVLLALPLLALPVLADSLDTADSLRNRDAFPLWSDSSLARADSMARPPAGNLQRWLLPAGVILVSATAAWLLFSVRSR